MIAWLRRLFCKHEHVVLVKTYSPPTTPLFGRLKGTSSYVETLMSMQERAVHGCTDVIVSCSNCGDCRNYTLLGKEES